VALDAILLIVVVAVVYWALPKLKLSDRSDLVFLLTRLAAVLMLGLLLIVVAILQGRYCVYKHGVGYCRAQTEPGLALLLGVPVVWICGSFLGLRGWARRIMEREGART
jgi:hypothetical protein